MTHPKKEQYQVLLSDSSPPIIEKRLREEQKKRAETWYYLGFIGEIGFTIATPIAGGAILGVIIDRQWSIYPKATLTLLFLGIVVSAISFVQTIREVIRRK